MVIFIVCQMTCLMTWYDLSSLFRDGPNGSNNHTQGTNYINLLSTVNYNRVFLLPGPHIYTSTRMKYHVFVLLNKSCKECFFFVNNHSTILTETILTVRIRNRKKSNDWHSLIFREIRLYRILKGSLCR